MKIAFPTDILRYMFSITNDIEEYNCIIYNSIEQCKDCDIICLDLASKIEQFPNEDSLKMYLSSLDKSKKYFGLWPFGEGMTHRNNYWKMVLESGIPIYSSTYEPELISYENFYYDMSWSFHYFNVYYGYFYFQKDDLSEMVYDKTYKVGLYGLSEWKEKEAQTGSRSWRNEYIDWFKNKSGVLIKTYRNKIEHAISEQFRNQHFTTMYEFRNCNYFICSETHFGVMPNTFPYFTSEKILKSAFMECFGVNTILITSPVHFMELHDKGFKFANSEFIKSYTSDGIINSVYDTFNHSEIIKTNNRFLVSEMLNTNIFKKYNII